MKTKSFGFSLLFAIVFLTLSTSACKSSPETKDVSVEGEGVSIEGESAQVVRYQRAQPEEYKKKGTKKVNKQNQ